ncbi:MAG: hypothetical protein E6R04_08985 [Spirochaetes bacterium]|nr:MAG: hypothetical protein E6R04_08985 [Spirochaetota bacterium]
MAPCVTEVVVFVAALLYRDKLRRQEHEDAFLRRADEPRLDAGMVEYRRQSPEPRTTDIAGQINPFHDSRATYRGVGLAAFTPNANIVRRTRSQRVPTVTARKSSTDS